MSYLLALGEAGWGVQGNSLYYIHTIPISLELV